MKLNYYPYTIRLKDQFAIASGSRVTTPAVMVEIKFEGITGYGEASLPPYLSENQSSVFDFLNKINLESYNDISDINNILNYVESVENGNNAAKASVDIALHDIWAKINNLPLHKLLGIEHKENLFTSFTIGISEPEELERKILAASEYKFLKIKLGSDNDYETITLIRRYTDKPLYVDVNQGWTDKFFALDMINWLSEQNVILIEQPLPKDNFDDAKWLLERSSLPIIADEAVQILSDLKKNKDNYSGVNIKLMKAGGLRNALQMIKLARQLNLKIMLGCMTETSCAITAASHLAPLADWIDLDGAKLISNDLFDGMQIKNGEIDIPADSGLGISKKLT
ncbi:MAG: dipeptide epimerase [Ignavibacteriota bacterium]|nr:MAG: dipeptide epimerase [Chlorobiota bacterium]MBL1121337.1 dipeptide epimerase [Ignavibacteriota bacterium]MCC7094824.1 dipeptide epimerase [Ignavibacteriaceae bacterium]MCE7855171.1 dipeptide epimerase [Ignavibacteria bacterium CHB3]MEB2295947.1 dipeptide epimerase [Ignavibacteria bacterium]